VTTTEPFAEVGTQNLWSVTTLIKKGLGFGEGMIQWAARVTAEQALDARQTLDQMIAEVGRDAAVSWLVEQRRKTSAKAQVRGTEVHAAAERLALGQDVGPVDPEHLPYVRQLSKWLEAFQPTYLMAECPLYNPTYGYAGTSDGIMELSGERLIFDYKTTDKGPNHPGSRHPYPDVALQLCAYRRAELVGVLAEQRYAGWGGRFYVFDPTAHHEPMPETDGAICIVISPEDCFAQVVRTDENVWRAFTYVQQVAGWQEELSHDVLKSILLPPRRSE
jgi:hypothetical protein